MSYAVTVAEEEYILLGRIVKNKKAHFDIEFLYIEHCQGRQKMSLRFAIKEGYQHESSAIDILHYWMRDTDNTIKTIKEKGT